MTFYIHIFNCIGVLLILSVYQSKMSKQLNNRKKVLEIFLQSVLTFKNCKIVKSGLKSAPFIDRKTLTFDLYITECLQKCLLPFINKHSKAVIFWLDLATIHHSKKTMEWYNQNGIKIVSNPPNCPEQRVIESYWTLVKEILLKSNKSAKDDEEFKQRWVAAWKKVIESKIQTMVAPTLKKI